MRVSLSALALVAGLLVAPTGALAADDSAALTFGAALLQARVSVAPIAPATRAGGAVRLPVRALENGVVRLDGGVVLRSGQRRARLTGLQLTTTGGSWSLRGRVGSKAATTLGTVVPPASAPAPTSTAVRLSGAQLQLSSTGARLLNRALRPHTELRAGAIGTASVDAQTATAGARPITGGTVTWGYNTALRTVFASAFTPLLSGGVTQGADGQFVLPVTGGTWDPATGTGSIATGGALRIGYQVAPTDATAHGIWVRLANARIDLAGASGQITATSDSGYHETAPVAPAVRTIATLAPGAPVASGATLTWTAIPARIAAGGDELVQYFKDSPGRPSLGDVHAIDPVTISVQLG